MVDKRFSELVAASDATEKARPLAVSAEESGAWLNALPAASSGNLLDNDSLRISVGLLLGKVLCEPHLCKCSAPVDTYGRNGLSCRFSAGPHS